jgi:hypothetical protein
MAKQSAVRLTAAIALLDGGLQSGTAGGSEWKTAKQRCQDAVQVTAMDQFLFGEGRWKRGREGTGSAGGIPTVQEPIRDQSGNSHL